MNRAHAAGLLPGRDCPSLVFLNELGTAYCVPEAGINYKRLIEFARNPCGFPGDELRRGRAKDKEARRVGGLRRGFSFPLLAQRNFFPIDRDVARRLDADANLRTVDGHHSHFNGIADAQCLTGPASEYQHKSAPADSMAY
jgi:hypothetical protein